MKASKPTADLSGFFGAVLLVGGGLATLGGSNGPGQVVAVIGAALVIYAFVLNVIGFENKKIK